MAATPDPDVHPLLERLKKIEKGSLITKGQAFDILIESVAAKIPFRMVQEALKDWDEKVETLKPSTFNCQFQQIKRKRRDLVKNNFSKLDHYLNEPFTLDNIKPRPVKRKFEQVEESESAVKDNLTCENVQKSENNLMAQIGFLQKKVQELEKTNLILRQDNRTYHDKIHHLKIELNTYNKKRINQILKRKNDSIKYWRNAYYNLKSQCPKLQTVNKLKQNLAKTQKKAKRTRDRGYKTMSKLSDKSRKLEKKIDTLTNEMQIKLAEKQTVIRDKNQDLVFLENEVEELKQQDMAPIELHTKIDGKTFSPKIRKASYVLQSAGVPQDEVSNTLQNVVQTITGQSLTGPLPSYGSQNYFMHEMKAFSRQQIKENVSSSSHNTLKYDGTTKALGNLVECEISTKEQTYLVGLKLQAGGRATDYCETIIIT